MLRTTLLVTIFLSLPAMSETLFLNANYSVPVTDDADFTLNTFALENYKVEINSPTDTEMSFSLPTEMTGVASQKLTFKLKSKLQDNTKVLTSANGKAICKGKWVDMQCDFVFKNISTSQSGLKRITEEKLAPEQVNARLKILRAFSNDPIGVAKVFAR